MKTKELIEMLQKEDPDGEAYVRISVGAPMYVVGKPGYFDGPYSYMDGDVYVTSREGSKVDIYCQEPDDIIWDEDGGMDKIKKRFRFDGDRPEEERRFWKYAEKEAAYVRKRDEISVKSFLEGKINPQLDAGMEIFQSKENPIGRYNVLSYVHSVTGEIQKLCQGECEAVLKSGLFTVKEREDGFFWVKKK